jgi:cytoskeletal protein RodZ
MDELLKKYSIEEITKRTSISPIFLQKLIEEKFDKIDKLKFKGFLKILKSEFKDIDFNDLEDKANSYYFISDDSKKTGKQQLVEELDQNNKNYKGYLFVFLLLVVIIGLIYYMKLNEKAKIENSNPKLDSLKVENIIEKNDSNVTDKDSKIQVSDETNITNTVEHNTTTLTNIEKNISKKYIDTKLTITPLKLVWFKVYYLDLNKSKEYLTSNPVELNASKKMFIKFGHGMVKLVYNGKTFAPDRKNITRIIVENGDINITNKKVESFK